MDWPGLAVAGPAGVVFLVLTTLVLRLATHLSADRRAQIREITDLRERRNRELTRKDEQIEQLTAQIDVWRRRCWEAEDHAAQYRREIEQLRHEMTTKTPESDE